ncbi:MAG: phosphatidylserine decarboxylase family protein [Caldilineaceae bacterium]|nr:phosphatidylserine decarboxylase family protein [Caldilineaceae bacterium]
MIGGAQAAWREVRWVVLALVGSTVVGALLRWRGVAIVAGGLLAWVCYFFRDPDRTPDAEGAEFILPRRMGGCRASLWSMRPHLFDVPATRISLFLSLFDVHVQRMPDTGVVRVVDYRPGSFAPAFLADSEANEANFIGVESERGPLLVAQMTGILARRIVCWAKPGDGLAKGQRFGLIKFGSRVDLYLPADCDVMVTPGQHVYGGQSVVARWSGNGLAKTEESVNRP